MRFLKDIFHLFFPKTCLCCQEQLLRNEKVICLKCRYELPDTDFTEELNNKIEQTFFGRIPIAFATTLLLYKTKSKSQKLIYQLKYNNHQEIGVFLGKWLGNQLNNSKRFNALKPIDYIVPVPLHPKKFKARGYNQLTTFGKSISEIINAAYIDNLLIKKSFSDTQTLKQRFERWKNVREIFYLTNVNFFENKHILLIDDVITTGATLEACALQLLQTKNIKISIATMAYTE